ncbi:uncharacterized protein LOC112684850 [Sipha flava]|uniref:Uncharacterized protein LOC112684850 n=1 Tax=Sipha flava TaxID=143950 RepID=A0A2S2Q688_9HEMI|nr:uncharacterized protein LOC112684850 [Sipha flava]
MYRRTVSVSLLCAAVAVASVAAVAAAGGGADADGGQLLDRVLDRCSYGPGAVNCLKSTVLEFLGAGGGGRAAKSVPDSELDTELVKATGAYVEHQVLDTGRAMDDGAMMSGQSQQQQQMQQMQQMQMQQPTTTTTARADMEMGMMQDKMLMPLMMMMKLKLKMLTPIMMALVSMKATKALILSKVAIMLVLGFLLKEFMKKSGLPSLLPIHLPGMPGPDPSTTASPPHMYGPPQSSGGYGGESSWEPATSYSSSSGHSSDAAHSMAYNSYLPSSSSGTSSSLSATKY